MTNTEIKKKNALSAGVKYLLFFLGLLAMLALCRQLTLDRMVATIGENTGLSPAEAALLRDFRWVLLVAMGADLTLLAFAQRVKRVGPERLYPAAILLFGGLYLWITTPLSVSDETAHFMAACEVSQDLTGLTLHEALFDWRDYALHNATATGALRVLRELLLPLEESPATQMHIITGLNSLVYAGEYIPQALGVTVGLLLGRSAVATLLLGRLTNLMFYALCVALALRMAPRFRNTLGMAALLPSALQQGASLSYDAFINGLSFLLLGGLLSAILGEGRIRKRELLCILVPGMLLTPAKGVYVLLLVLVVLIPAERFGGAGRKALTMLGLCGACGMFFVLMLLPRMVNFTLPEATATRGYPFTYVLEHPVHTAEIFYRSVNATMRGLVEDAIGNNLSVGSIPLPSWLVVLAEGALLLSVQPVSGEETKLPKGFRRFCAAICAAVFMLYLATMFFTWVMPGEEIIWGIQGRYLIPVLPLLFMAMRCKQLELKKNPGEVLFMLTVLISCRAGLEILNQTINRA